MSVKKLSDSSDGRTQSRKVIYICHPLRNNSDGNRERLVSICRNITEQGHTPLAPQLAVPEYIDEGTEQELALKHCLQLLELVDEVWAYGEPTACMEQEIAAARENRIPVRTLP